MVNTDPKVMKIRKLNFCHFTQIMYRNKMADFSNKPDYIRLYILFFFEIEMDLSSGSNSTFAAGLPSRNVLYFYLVFCLIFFKSYDRKRINVSIHHFNKKVDHLLFLAVTQLTEVWVSTVSPITKAELF